MLNRIVATTIAAVASITGFACSQTAPQVDADGKDLAVKWKDASMYAIEAKALDGSDAKLAQYEGKVALVVNVASQCGLTPQYTALQGLADRFRDKGLVVIGIPSGDFGGQEFDSAQEIREFCDTQYNVTFPLLEKSGVKAGKAQSPIFEFLGTKTGELPGWNFGKYIVSRDGKRAVFFSSMTKPDDGKVIAAIEKMLAEEAAPTKAAANSETKETTPGTAPTPASPSTSPTTQPTPK